MPRNHLALAAAGALAVAFAAVAFAASDAELEPHPLDNPMYRIDAQYHHLPQTLIDRLLKDAPRHGYSGSTYWCYGARDATDEGTGYCVCWGEAGCRQLAKEAACDAKIGAFDNNGTGVCRSRVETIIVG